MNVTRAEHTVSSDPSQTTMSQGKRGVGNAAMIIGSGLVQPLFALPAVAMAVVNKVKYIQSEIKLGKLETQRNVLLAKKNATPANTHYNENDEAFLSVLSEGAKGETSEIDKQLDKIETEIQKTSLKKDKQWSGFISNALAAVPFAGICLSAIYSANKIPGTETGIRAGVEALGTATVVQKMVQVFRGADSACDAILDGLHPKRNDKPHMDTPPPDNAEEMQTYNDKLMSHNKNLKEHGFEPTQLKVPRSKNENGQEVTSSLVIFKSPGFIPGNPTKLIFHGNGELPNEQVQLALDFKAQGYNVVIASMGGYPDNHDGIRTTEASTYQDAHAIMNWLNGQEVGIVGTSIGSTLATACAALRPDLVKEVQLRVPLDNFVNVSANSISNSTAFPGALVRGIARDKLPIGEEVYGVQGPDNKPFKTDQGNNVAKLQSALEHNKNMAIMIICGNKDDIMARNKEGDTYKDNFGKDIAKQLKDKIPGANIELHELDCDHNLIGAKKESIQDKTSQLMVAHDRKNMPSSFVKREAEFPAILENHLKRLDDFEAKLQTPPKTEAEFLQLANEIDQLRGEITAFDKEIHQHNLPELFAKNSKVESRGLDLLTKLNEFAPVSLSTQLSASEAKHINKNVTNKYFTYTNEKGEHRGFVNGHAIAILQKGTMFYIMDKKGRLAETTSDTPHEAVEKYVQKFNESSSEKSEPLRAAEFSKIPAPGNTQISTILAQKISENAPNKYFIYTSEEGQLLCMFDRQAYHITPQEDGSYKTLDGDGKVIDESSNSPEEAAKKAVVSTGIESQLLTFQEFKFFSRKLSS